MSGAAPPPVTPGGLVACLPGDGVGPEVVAQAVRVVREVAAHFGLNLRFEEAPVGYAAILQQGEPLPPETLDLADRSQAILFGAVGDPRAAGLPRPSRPEQALATLRKRYDLYVNLRPAVIYPALREISPLRPEYLEPQVDLIIVRELAGGIYFGEPRGIEALPDGGSRGFNTEVYTTREVERVARWAFRLAQERRGRVTSVDKANTLESGELWRRVVTAVGQEYPDVELEHLYVDAAAMELLRAPGRFDVIVTNNIFGDILSDEAAMLAGSIGLGASASLGSGGVALYEGIHGSAPDIAGKDRANPVATILSGAMMLRYSFGAPDAAGLIEAATAQAIAGGTRTADIARRGETPVGTQEMTDRILAQCEVLARQ